MGFATYSLTDANEGVFRLKRENALRLNGPEGPIARHVTGKTFEDGLWSLEASELSAGRNPVLFESRAPDGRIHLQRVHGVNGRSTDEKTEVLVEMEMLVVCGELEGSVEVKPTEIRASEALSLSGGMTAGRGKWAWMPPKMQLGSTTIGMRRRAFVAAFLLGLLSSICGLHASATSVVTVAAAANLSPVLPALEREFSKVDPTPVRFIVGSSGKLAAQILQGAPFDVFLSADESYPLRLLKEGKCVRAPRVYAEGVLVLVFRRDAALNESPGGVDWSRIARIALADPALAPYGRAAAEYLGSTADGREFTGKRVIGQSIGQTAQFLLSGSVDAGFLALSQVKSLPVGKWTWTTVPAESYAPIRQMAALLSRNGEGASDAASAYFDFLFSPTAIAIFEKAGYRAPGPTDDATDSP